MAGGGKVEQAQPNQDIAPVVPGYLKNTAAATMPAFMPGQREQVAGSLYNGFGGTPGAFSRYLDQIYDPAQTLNFNAPKPVAPKPKPKGGGTVPAAKPAGRTYPLPGGRNAR